MSSKSKKVMESKQLMKEKFVKSHFRDRNRIREKLRKRGIMYNKILECEYESKHQNEIKIAKMNKKDIEDLFEKEYADLLRKRVEKKELIRKMEEDIKRNPINMLKQYIMYCDEHNKRCDLW